MRTALVCLLTFLPAALGTEVGPPPREVRVDRYGDPLPEGAVMRLGTTRGRHVGAYQISCSEDGKRVVTVGDRHVEVRDAADGKILSRHRIPGDGWDTCEAVGRSGQFTVVRGKDGLEVHDVFNRKLIRKLPYGETDTFTAAAISTDEKFVATVDYTPREHRVRVWDIEKGTNIVVGVVERPGRSLRFSPDGTKVCCMTHQVDSDRTLYCWDVAGQKQLWEYKGAADIEFSADGRTGLATFDRPQKDARGLIDMATGERNGTYEWPIHFDTPPYILSPDGKVVVVAAVTDTRVCDAASGKLRITLDVHQRHGCFSADGQSYFVIDDVGQVRRFRLVDGKESFPPLTDEHLSGVGQLVWSSDGRQLAATGWVKQHRVSIWNLDDGKFVRWLNTTTGRIVDPQFTKDGQHLVAGNDDSVIAWEIVSGKQISEWTFKLTRQKPRSSHCKETVRNIQLHASSDLAYVLVEGNCHEAEEALAVVDWQTGKLISQKPEELGLFPKLGSHHVVDGRGISALRPNGPFVAVEDEEKWVKSYTPFLSQDASVASGYGSVLSNEGGETVSAFIVLERATGRIIRKVASKNSFCHDFSPDGRLLALGSSDGLLVFDLALNREVLRRSLPERQHVNVISWSPDGRLIATGLGDTTILIWNGPIAAPAAILRDVDLFVLWEDLGSPNAAKGMLAVWKLRERPTQSVPLIRERLIEANKPTAEEVRSLIHYGLDDKNFRVRDAAERQLSAIGDRARSQLESARKANPSQEQKVRIDRVLAALALDKPPAGDDLRAIRCVNVLENVADKECRAMLKELAKGPDSMRLTWEAREALERMGERK